MLRRLLPIALFGVAFAIPAPALATVTGEGIGVSVVLESDGAADDIALTCVGGMAPGGATTQIPCGSVETVIVDAGGGNDTVEFEDVTKATFPALTRTEIETGEGQDVVLGSAIGDTVLADEGDVVVGGAGNDFISGAGEALGGEGDDLVFEATGLSEGGPGDDRFENPGPFAESNGGPGLDSYVRDFPAAEPFSVLLGVEDDGLRINGGSFKFAWSSIERAELFLTDVGVQSVDASGFSGSIVVDGRGGPDTIVGSPGEDLISGGAGDDDLTGNGGFDWVRGGEGADQLRLRDGAVDRGVCGDGADHAVADAADSLEGCEAVDLPVASDSSTAGSSAPGPQNSSSPPPVPETRGLKGPKAVFKGKRATFRFASSEKGSTFKCKVDNGQFKVCKSPLHLSTGKLPPGRHTVAVVAVGSTGTPDPTPATLGFTVKPKPKPRKHGRP